LKLLDTEISDSNPEEEPDITEEDVDHSLETTYKTLVTLPLLPDSKLE